MVYSYYWDACIVGTHHLHTGEERSRGSHCHTQTNKARELEWAIEGYHFNNVRLRHKESSKELEEEGASIFNDVLTGL